jgi:hypothetical protein
MENAEPISNFKCCHEKKLSASATEAKCAIEHMRDRALSLGGFFCFDFKGTVAGMARSVTALSCRCSEDGSPGPCPLGWGVSLRLKSENSDARPILGCASDLYLPQLR